MFVVTKNSEPLSPYIMRFQKLWLYDLRPFHDFWKKTILHKQLRSSSSLCWADSPWEALLKIYGIHTFAPTESLEDFARDYHQHFGNSVSEKSYQKFFDCLRRLGLQRVGHLQRLSFIEVGKRFGKAWSDFFRGIKEPKTTPWIWEAFRAPEPLVWRSDFEEPSTDALFILEQICRGVDILSSQAPRSIQRMEISIQHSENETIDFCFQHPIQASKERDWIRKLLSERLCQLQLEASVTRVGLRLFLAELSPSVQLSLFNQDSQKLNLKELCRRLENQGFQIFKPSSAPSYLPEKSWFRVSPLSSSPSESRHALWRPLIQFPPEPIHPPQGILKPTEQLEWLKPDGRLCSRQYFLTRFPRYWAWVFRDQDGQWFRQGVLE